MGFEWRRRIGVEELRSRWEMAAQLLTPQTGWPSDMRDQRLDVGEVHNIDMAELAAALAVAASRPEYWEANALVVSFSSEGGHAPHESWEVLASLRPDGDDWSQQIGLPSFAISQGAVFPARALVAAGLVMVASYDFRALDGLGYVTAGGDWEDCLARCGQDRACWLRCMSNG